MVRRCRPTVITFGVVAPSSDSQSNASITYSAKSLARTNPASGRWKRMSFVSRL